MGKQYDLAVIGSGPAGQRAAVQAAKLNKKVIVIEKNKIGGNCLHYGTIPSKTLREAVLLENRKQSEFLAQVMKRKNKVVSGEVEVINDQLKRNKVKYIQGTASFIDSNNLSILGTSGKKQKITATSIIIATGTRPRRPKEISFKKNIVMDSDSVLTLKKIPKSICILGAGVIGCEYASIFLEMGIQVTLLDRRTDLLRGIDREIVASLEHSFQKNKGKLILGAEVEDIQSKANKAYLKVNGKQKSFGALLYCMGRVGNTEDLKLENAKIKCNDRGLIKVNSSFQTNKKNIYAVGDIIGAPALAASAYEQGRLAACHCLEQTKVSFPKFFPFGIYTIPEISSVGDDEESLVQKKIPYIVGKAKYKELARGKILEDEFGVVKLIFHKKNHKLLGAHIIGTQATELIHIGQMAMAYSATVEQLSSMVFNYPTLAEAYKVACLNAYNQLR